MDVKNAVKVVLPGVAFWGTFVGLGPIGLAYSMGARIGYSFLVGSLVDATIYALDPNDPKNPTVTAKVKQMAAKKKAVGSLQFSK